MIVVTNASPLIALGQADVLPILGQLFGRVMMPDTVYEETVTGCHVIIQKIAIETALDDFLSVEIPHHRYSYSRNLGIGEAGVLDLARDIQADLLLIDDKKARNEAKALGFKCAFTSDILRYAEQMNLVDYAHIVSQLRRANIFIP